MTTTAPTPTEALASRIASLRTRAGSANRDRLLLYVGGALLPLGLLVVILGWYGASHTVLLFEQIPYLISGGQIGTALVFAGGFIYFAYWLSLLVRESRSRHEEMVTVLRDIHAQLAGSAGTAGLGGVAVTSGDRAVGAGTAGAVITGANPVVDAGPGQAAGPAPDLVATANGSMVHRPDCQVVAGKDGLRRVEDLAGLVPCKLCRPLD